MQILWNEFHNLSRNFQPWVNVSSITENVKFLFMFPNKILSSEQPTQKTFFATEQKLFATELSHSNPPTQVLSLKCLFCREKFFLIFWTHPPSSAKIKL
jgi:hypothetical protein